jgi:hypothetical protein
MISRTLSFNAVVACEKHENIITEHEIVIRFGAVR